MAVKCQLYNKDGVLENRTLTRSRAVRERCFQCSNYQPSEVTRCSHVSCPLFPFRKGTSKNSSPKRNEAVKAYCTWCMAGQKHEIKNCTAKHCPLYHFRIGASRTEVDKVDKGPPTLILEEVTPFGKAEFDKIQGTMTGRTLLRRPNFKEV